MKYKMLLVIFNILVYINLVNAADNTGISTPWGPAPAIEAYKAKLKASQIYRVPANPDKGFHFPYFFTVPATFAPNTPILINPNNDGKVGISDKQREYFASILNEEISYVFGRKLKVVTLTPSFPRPKQAKNNNIYIHALTRDAITSQKPNLQRIDLQLLAMQADLKQKLLRNDIKTSDSLLLYGFSAAADFVTRFAAIHPNKVDAVVAGGLGGLPISTLNDNFLTFPVGVGDFKEMVGKEFDQQTFSQIPMLLVQGSIDDNDSVPEGQELQQKQHFSSDSYNYEQAIWINKTFDSLPINRLPLVRRIYQKLAPTDFAYAVLFNEAHSDKHIKPKAVDFFHCVMKQDRGCAQTAKKIIENNVP